MSDELLSWRNQRPINRISRRCFNRGGGDNSEVADMSNNILGQTIQIIETRYGGNGTGKHTTKRSGRVVQVCERFVAVHNGKYVECVWTDQDEKNNPVVEGVLG